MNNCFIYPGVVINPLTLRSLDQTQNQQQNEIIQMLSKAAKTDDDLEDDDCDLGDALGGWAHGHAKDERSYKRIKATKSELCD